MPQTEATVPSLSKRQHDEDRARARARALRGKPSAIILVLLVVAVATLPEVARYALAGDLLQAFVFVLLAAGCVAGALITTRKAYQKADAALYRKEDA